jgi:hypothetical protein
LPYANPSGDDLFKMFAENTPDGLVCRENRNLSVLCTTGKNIKDSPKIDGLLEKMNQLLH